MSLGVPTKRMNQRATSLDPRPRLNGRAESLLNSAGNSTTQSSSTGHTRNRRLPVATVTDWTSNPSERIPRNSPSKPGFSTLTPAPISLSVRHRTIQPWIRRPRMSVNPPSPIQGRAGSIVETKTAVTTLPTITPNPIPSARKRDRLLQEARHFRVNSLGVAFMSTEEDEPRRAARPSRPTSPCARPRCSSYA